MNIRERFSAAMLITFLHDGKASCHEALSDIRTCNSIAGNLEPFQGSSLVILKGLRHMALAEAPQLFNSKLLGFLDAVAPAG